jgi:hypothetical protein
LSTGLIAQTAGAEGLEGLVMDIQDIDPNTVTDSQYALIAEQRRHFDTMVWSTPATTLAGLAFLFTIALGDGNVQGRIIASVLALVVCLAAVQLLGKHRYFEVHYSKLLEHVERARAPVHQLRPKAKGWQGWSSYLLWKTLFLIFAFSALLNLFLIFLAKI